MTFSYTYINIQRKSNYKIDLHSIREKTRITLKMYKINDTIEQRRNGNSLIIPYPADS
jgi:hypothetical protein